MLQLQNESVESFIANNFRGYFLLHTVELAVTRDLRMADGSGPRSAEYFGSAAGLRIFR